MTQQYKTQTFIISLSLPSGDNPNNVIDEIENALVEDDFEVVTVTVQETPQETDDNVQYQQNK
tara:strand:- start:621 stop:809 length:189 start_codon:yes stop_codon:yes gene_type:complete